MAPGLRRALAGLGDGRAICGSQGNPAGLKRVRDVPCVGVVKVALPMRGP